MQFGRLQDTHGARGRADAFGAGQNGGASDGAGRGVGQGHGRGAADDAPVRILLGKKELKAQGIDGDIAPGQRFVLQAKAVAEEVHGHGDARAQVPFALRITSLKPDAQHEGQEQHEDEDEAFFRGVFEGGA